MVDIEQLIQKQLHPKSTWATTGDESLDFHIAEAERITAAAKAELEALRKQVWDGHLELSEGLKFKARSIADAAKQGSLHYLQIMSLHLEMSQNRGRSTIEARNQKPQTATDSEISQRWQSLIRLLDSQSPALILSVMQRESSSDDLSRYLLRSHDAELYILSKGLDVTDFFRMIGASADILEIDIQEAAENIVKALEHTKAAVPAWEKQFYVINDLWKIVGSIFEPAPFASRQSIIAQSDSNGAINLRFPNMDSFREWARTPKI